MSDNVVSLDAHRTVPHLSGKARCLACEHEWVATKAITADSSHAALTCPSCQTFRGVFKATVSPDVFWRCNCGCDVFMLDGDSPGWCPRCINCGSIAAPTD